MYQSQLLEFHKSNLCAFYLQHHVDPAIGVYIIDRYTYFALEFLENVNAQSQRTMGEFVSIFLFLNMFTNKEKQNVEEILISNFFNIYECFIIYVSVESLS